MAMKICLWYVASITVTLQQLFKNKYTQHARALVLYIWMYNLGYAVVSSYIVIWLSQAIT